MADEETYNAPPVVPHGTASINRKRRMTIQPGFPWKKTYNPRNFHDLRGAEHLIASELPEGFPEELAFRALAVYSLLRTLSRELRLSPFTPNVFLRALNLPYPSRLIGQVHVALLRILLPTLGYTYRQRGMALYKKRKIDGLKWLLRGGDNLTYLDTYSWPLFYDDYVHLTADTLFERMHDTTSHIDFRSHALQVDDDDDDDFVQSDPEGEEEKEAEQTSPKFIRGRGHGLPTRKGRGRPTILQKAMPRTGVLSSGKAGPPPFQPTNKKRKVEEEPESDSDASFQSEDTESEDEDFSAPRRGARKASTGGRAKSNKREETLPFQPDTPATCSGLSPQHLPVHHGGALTTHSMPPPHIFPPHPGIPMVNHAAMVGHYNMSTTPMTATYTTQQQVPSAISGVHHSVAPHALPPQMASTHVTYNPVASHVQPSKMAPTTWNSVVSTHTVAMRAIQSPETSPVPPTQTAAAPATQNGATSQLPTTQMDSTAANQLPVSAAILTKQTTSSPEIQKHTADMPATQNCVAAPGPLMQPVQPPKLPLESSAAPLRAMPVASNSQSEGGPNALSDVAPLIDPSARSNAAPRVPIATSAPIYSTDLQLPLASILQPPKPMQPAPSVYPTTSNSKSATAQAGQKRPLEATTMASSFMQTPTVTPLQSGLAAQRAMHMVARQQHLLMMQRHGVPHMGAMPRPGMMSMPRPGQPFMGDFPRPEIAPNMPAFMSGTVKPMLPMAAMGTQLPRSSTQIPRPGVSSSLSQMPPRPRVKAPPVPKMMLKKAKRRGLAVDDGVANAIEKFLSSKAGLSQVKDDGSAYNAESSTDQQMQMESNPDVSASGSVNMEDLLASSASQDPWEEENDKWPQFDSVKRMRDGVPHHRLDLEDKICIMEFLVDELLTIDYVAAEFTRRHAVTSCYSEPLGVLPTKEELETLENADECGVCGLEGDLLCCDGCPASYHKRCIGMDQKTQLPDGVWLCPECQVKDPALFGSLKGDRKACVDWVTIKDLKHLCCPPVEFQLPLQPDNATLSGLLDSSTALVGQRSNLGMASHLCLIANNSFNPQMENPCQASIIQSDKASLPTEYDEAVMIIQGFVFKKRISTSDQRIFDSRDKVKTLKYESESHKTFQSREVFSFLQLVGQELVSQWPLVQIPLSPVKMWGTPSPHSRSQSIETYFITDKSFDPSKYQSAYRLAPLPKALKAGAGSKDPALVAADYDNQCHHTDLRLLSANITADASSDKSLSRALRLGTSLFYPYKIIGGYLEKLETNLYKAGLLSEFWGLRNHKSFRQDTWTQNVQRCRSIPRLAKLLVKIIDAAHPLTFHEDWFQPLNARGGRASREESTLDEKRMYISLPDDWAPSLEKKKRKWEQCADSNVLTLLSEDSKSLSEFIDGAKLKDKLIGRKRKKVHSILKRAKNTDQLFPDHIKDGLPASGLQRGMVEEARHAKSASVVLASMQSPGSTVDVASSLLPASTGIFPSTFSAPTHTATGGSVSSDGNLPPAFSAPTHTTAGISASSSGNLPSNFSAQSPATIGASASSSGNLPPSFSVPSGLSASLNANLQHTNLAPTPTTTGLSASSSANLLTTFSELIPAKVEVSVLSITDQPRLQPTGLVASAPKPSEDSTTTRPKRDDSAPAEEMLTSRSRRSRRQGGHDKGGEFSNGSSSAGIESDIKRARAKKIKDVEGMLMHPTEKEIIWPVCGRYFFDPIGYIPPSEMRRLGRKAGSVVAPHVSYLKTQEVGQGAVCHVWRKRCLDCGSFEALILQIRALHSFLEQTVISTCEAAVRRYGSNKSPLQKGIACTQRDLSNGEPQYFVLHKLRHRGCWLPRHKMDTSLYVIEREKRADKIRIQWGKKALVERNRLKALTAQKAAQEAAQKAAVKRKVAAEAATASRAREAALVANAMKRKKTIAAAALLPRKTAVIRAPVHSQMPQTHLLGPAHTHAVPAHLLSSSLPLLSQTLPSRREISNGASQRKREIQQYQSDLEETLKQHELLTCKLLMQCLSSGLNAIPEQAMFELRDKHLTQLRKFNTNIGRLAGPNLKDEKLRVLMNNSEQIARSAFREKLSSIKKRSLAKISASQVHEQARAQYPTAYQQSPTDYTSLQHVQQRQIPQQQMAYSRPNLGEQSNLMGSRPGSAAQNLGAQVTSLSGAQVYEPNQSPYSPQGLYQQLGQARMARQQQPSYIQQEPSYTQQQPNYGGRHSSSPAQPMQGLYELQQQQQLLQQQQGSAPYSALFQQQAMQLQSNQRHTTFQQQLEAQPRSHQPRSQQRQRPQQQNQDAEMAFDFEPRPLEEMDSTGQPPNNHQQWM